jgi:hypothetical protein
VTGGGVGVGGRRAVLNFGGLVEAARSVNRGEILQGRSHADLNISRPLLMRNNVVTNLHLLMHMEMRFKVLRIMHKVEAVIEQQLLNVTSIHAINSNTL